MVWKGHYLGYGPADVLLHVPVDSRLMAENDKVQIFAPYHVEAVRLVRSAQAMPAFDSIEALAGKRVGVEKVSIAAMLLLGEGNGRFRDNVRIFPTAAAAMDELKAGRLDAVLANRSEIEAAFRGDPAFPLEQAVFQRLPRNGWAVGMAVRKDDQDVARLLQAAVNEMRASGELQAIFAKHGVRMLALAAMALVHGAGMAGGAHASPMASVEIVGMTPLPGLGVDRKTLPYAVQTASEAALARADGANLSELLARSFAGVNVNEISGSPFQNDLTYRGFRASPVLGTGQGISVYLDGVRVNEPFGDVVNWDMLPEAAIGSVLLAPGSNPLYGLNTLGGALALNTRSGASDPGFAGSISGGNHGQRRADLAYGVARDGWQLFTAATLFGDDGWRAHSDGRLANLFVKLGKVERNTEWHLTMLGGESRLVGNGLLPDGLYEDDRRAVYTWPDETRNRLRQAQLSVTRRLAPDMQLTAAAYLRNSRRDTVNGDIDDHYADYVEGCDEGFRSDGQPREPDECPYTRGQGAALHSASLNTTSTRQRSQGFSLQWSAQLTGLQLLAGLAHDRSKVGFAQYEQEAGFDALRGVSADGGERELDASVDGRARNSSAYASGTWTVAPATWLTASARYAHARVASTISNQGVPQPREAPAAACASSASDGNSGASCGNSGVSGVSGTSGISAGADAGADTGTTATAGALLPTAPTSSLPLRDKNQCITAAAASGRLSRVESGVA
eukprot:gene38365-47368_t